MIPSDLHPEATAPQSAPQEIFLLKLGEVVLKGLNRRSFEDKLVSNVRRRLKSCGSFQVSVRQSTIYVEPKAADCDLAAAHQICRQVFGIVAVARAVPCGKSVEEITATAKAYLGEALSSAKSFKVESKRADKLFPMAGAYVVQTLVPVLL